MPTRGIRGPDREAIKWLQAASQKRVQTDLLARAHDVGANSNSNNTLDGVLRSLLGQLAMMATLMAFLLWQLRHAQKSHITYPVNWDLYSMLAGFMMDPSLVPAQNGAGEPGVNLDFSLPDDGRENDFDFTPSGFDLPKESDRSTPDPSPGNPTVGTGFGFGGLF